LSPGWDQLARDYFNDTVNAPEPTGRLCSSWCRLDAAQSAAEAASADLAALESWWLANVRLSIGITGGAQLGPIRAGVSGEFEYGLREGGLDLRRDTSLRLGISRSWVEDGLPLSLRASGSIPIELRWDAPGGQTANLTVGGGQAVRVVLSETGTYGIGGVGVVFGRAPPVARGSIDAVGDPPAW
jgi:hypothetical protein